MTSTITFDLKRVSRVLTFFILCWFSLPCLAKSGVYGKVEKAYEYLLFLEYDQAQRALQGADRSNAMVFYVEDLSEAVQVFLTEDPEGYEAYLDHALDRIDILKDFPEEDPYRKMVMAEIRLHLSFLKLKFGDEFSSVWNLRKSYFLLRDNQKDFPDFVDDNKAMGIIYLMLGSVPDNYKWVLSMLSLRGSISQGIAQLQGVMTPGHYFNTEATLIYDVLNAYLLENGEQAVTSIRQLHSRFPGNPLVLFVYSSILIKQGHSEEALTSLEKVQTSTVRKTDLFLLDYLQGKALLQRGSYLEAAGYFQKFLAGFPGENYLKDTHYRLFLCYYLSGQKSQAEIYHKSAMQTGATRIESDRSAAKALEEESWPNQLLMSIRLKTDGGFYTQAVDLVEENPNPSLSTPRETCEFVYRKARLQHKRGEIELAIPLYEETMNLTGKNPWYYGANSALQLGYIYRDQGKKEQATRYFEKAGAYKSHEYKSSIDRKAEIALEALN